MTEFAVGCLLLGIAIGTACSIPYWLTRKWKRVWFIPLAAITGIVSSFILVILVHYLTQLGKPSNFPPLENPSINIPVLMCVIFIPPIAAFVGWWQSNLLSGS